MLDSTPGGQPVAHVLHSVEYRVCCTRCGETWTEIDEDTTPSDLRLGARHQHSCRRCGTTVEAQVVGALDDSAPTRAEASRRNGRRRAPRPHG